MPPCQAGPTRRVCRLQSNTPTQRLAGAGDDGDALEHSLSEIVHLGDLAGGGSPSGLWEQRSFCCSGVFQLTLRGLENRGSQS